MKACETSERTRRTKRHKTLTLFEGGDLSSARLYRNIFVTRWRKQQQWIKTAESKPEALSTQKYRAGAPPENFLGPRTLVCLRRLLKFVTEAELHAPTSSYMHAKHANVGAIRAEYRAEHQMQHFNTSMDTTGEDRALRCVRGQGSCLPRIYSCYKMW